MAPPAASHAARLPRSRRDTGSERWRRRLLLTAVLAAALVGGYLFWLRDSSLVEVRDVRVEGVSADNGEEIRAALTDAAQGMTTLHVDVDALEAAARRFPTVSSVTAESDFPNGLTIEVSERPPAALARFGSGVVAVAADGTVLAGAKTEELELPTLRVGGEPPPSGRLEGTALDQALVVGAAPEPLRPLIESASVSGSEGVTVTVREEIELRFGEPAGAEAKWAAAAAILADPKLDGLAYIDLRVPERPAVGGAGAESATSATAADPSTLPQAEPPPATDPAGTMAAP